MCEGCEGRVGRRSEEACAHVSFLHRNTCTALAKLAQMLTGAVASARDATVREPGFVHMCAAAASAARWPQPSSSHEDSCTMDEEDARAAMSARATCSIIVPFARHIRDARGHEHLPVMISVVYWYSSQ